MALSKRENEKRRATESARAAGAAGASMRGNALVRLAFNVLVIVVLALGVCAAAGVGLDAAGGGEIAVAADFDDGSGYADAFIGDQGWKADVIENADPDSKLDPGAHGENLVGGASDFFWSLSWIIIVLVSMFAVGRFAGRALLSLLYGGNNKDVDFNDKSDFWVLFMTGKERGNHKKLSPNWIMDMIKETFILLAVGIAAGAIVGLLVGVSTFVMDQITTSANQTGVGSFEMSELHMRTTK